MICCDTRKKCTEYGYFARLLTCKVTTDHTLTITFVHKNVDVHHKHVSSPSD